eukprot:CAMPEP_0168338828 /NCGR_PEP_ID=MMETSP0213-20121227/13093_1 /TAXON_ID=151035 /ORGANISM="Euplotes harpa, Strain FSP1.4" /LENGTH=63 /DNA_ID=CAMNT_0008344733 /DNA_START=6 /DNA_END=194 /DNA_ORIENTATION=-
MSIFKKGENLLDYYRIEDVLGEGSFSIVKDGVNKATGEHVAIKIVKKSMLGTEEATSLENEVM